MYAYVTLFSTAVEMQLNSSPYFRMNITASQNLISLFDVPSGVRIPWSRVMLVCLCPVG
jgi:hypothetical protein